MNTALAPSSARQAPDRSTPIGSVRTCIGCGAAASPGEMSRLSLDSAGTPTLLRQGRGAHVHPRARCITGAARRGLSRTFRRDVKVTEHALATTVVSAAVETVRASIASATRLRVVSVGTDELARALDAGEARCCVVAVDAGDETNHPAVARAMAAGNTVVFGRRRDLGALVRRGDAAIVGILHARLASRITTACASIDALRVISVPEVG